MQIAPEGIFINVPFYRISMIPFIVQGLKLAGLNISSVTVKYEDSGEVETIKDDKPPFPSIQWLSKYKPSEVTHDR